MRKVWAIIAAAGICCVSCGSAGSERPDITGMWRIDDPDANGGYIFADDGSADVYIYPEDTALDSGELLLYGTHIPDGNISYDGDILAITMLDQDYLVMDRIGEPNADSYIGEYQVTGGQMKDIIVNSLGVSDTNSVDLRIDIQEGDIRITIKDIIEYDFNGSRLELKGKNGLPDSSGDAELDGDTLAVKRTDGGERVLVRVS